jgi:hypothetical protein
VYAAIGACNLAVWLLAGTLPAELEEAQEPEPEPEPVPGPEGEGGGQGGGQEGAVVKRRAGAAAEVV